MQGAPLSPQEKGQPLMSKAAICKEGPCLNPSPSSSVPFWQGLLLQITSELATLGRLALAAEAILTQMFLQSQKTSSPWAKSQVQGQQPWQQDFSIKAGGGLKRASCLKNDTGGRLSYFLKLGTTVMLFLGWNHLTCLLHSSNRNSDMRKTSERYQVSYR